MKRILMLGVLLVALSVSGYAQKKPYKVVFYNLENFSIHKMIRMFSMMSLLLTDLRSGLRISMIKSCII